MTTLADLHRAVQSTVAGKRLGRPVFVRYLVRSRDKPDAALPRLAHLTGAVRDWIGEPLERVYAVGTPKSGQIALTLEFGGGATALVCWAAAPPRGDGIDLAVIGNRGALYHDAGSACLHDEAALAPVAAPDKVLLAVLERAVRSGRPETLEGGGAP